MEEVEQLRAENAAMKATMRAWNEAQERRDATLLEREQLLVRLWRNDKGARRELDRLIDDDLKCVLDSMA
jgi:uncharacterized protein YjiS (DUF1127 family)